MDIFAPLQAIGVALLSLGAGHHAAPPTLLSCHGKFVEFVDGQPSMIRPSVDFVVDWRRPAIVTDTGRPGRITALTSLAIDFDMQYPGYLAHYRVNRIDGTISEASNFGGLYRGDCALGPLITKF
ncbi:MAG: hypothetical protein ACREFB_04950 [Stellaceae bacterium]